MAANAGIMIGWTRAQAGKEAEAQSKFPEFIGYMTKLQGNKQIESFEPVVLAPHGGDLNGFFIIRGEQEKLNHLRGSEEFKEWVSWGAFHMSGFGVNEIYLGATINEVMTRSAKFIKR